VPYGCSAPMYHGQARSCHMGRARSGISHAHRTYTTLILRHGHLHSGMLKHHCSASAPVSGDCRVHALVAIRWVLLTVANVIDQVPASCIRVQEWVLILAIRAARVCEGGHLRCVFTRARALGRVPYGHKGGAPYFGPANGVNICARRGHGHMLVLTGIQGPEMCSARIICTPTGCAHTMYSVPFGSTHGAGLLHSPKLLFLSGGQGPSREPLVNRRASVVL
jgi:hypothetical protein